MSFISAQFCHNIIHIGTVMLVQLFFGALILWGNISRLFRAMSCMMFFYYFIINLRSNSKQQIVKRYNKVAVRSFSVNLSKFFTNFHFT